MRNLLDNLALILVLCVHEGWEVLAQPCRSKNKTSADKSHIDCDERVIHQENEDNPVRSGGITSHAVYIVVVVSGVILIPLIVLVRICWLRKLQKQRDNAINDVRRRIVDQRLEEEQQRRSGIFSINLANVPFEEIYGKPPTYDECLRNPDMGHPPPYDDPPGYSQKQSDTYDQNREDNANPARHGIDENVLDP